MKIGVIETSYKGYRFRSRLEARWAVFLDALPVRWEYEKEGFHLKSGPYLPDFWLPEYQCWLEIKGQQPTKEERDKAWELASFTGSAVLLFVGLPGEENIGTMYFWGVRGDGGGLFECQASLTNDGYGALLLEAQEDSNGEAFYSDAGMTHELPISSLSNTGVAGGWVECCADKAKSARFEYDERGF